jgi:Ni/Co efflux regulator RcnB
MTFKTFLLAASAVACFAFPVTAFAAADPSGQPHGGGGGGGQHGGGGGPHSGGAPHGGGGVPHGGAVHSPNGGAPRTAGVGQHRSGGGFRQPGVLGYRSHAAEWRGAHTDWASHGVWANNHDWWRGRSGWEGYHGRRAHYYYAPGWGYYAIPAAYWATVWAVGDYLPEVFWQYEIVDYAGYGLYPPPPGCAWVWLNGDIALVDLDDGAIIDIAHNVW